MSHYDMGQFKNAYIYIDIDIDIDGFAKCFLRNQVANLQVSKLLICFTEPWGPHEIPCDCRVIMYIDPYVANH